MKNKKIISMAALLIASLTITQAQTTLVDWTFDNNGLGINLNPAPSTGIDLATATATTVGLTTTLTTKPSIAEPDIINTVPGSSTPSTPDTWRIRGNGASPNNGNGWTSASGIGTQGAEFTASTVGYNNIKLTFDVAPTTQGEAFLQVEYTTDGTTWNNATLTYSANPGLVLNNSTPASGGNGIVVGSYLNMTGTAAWYNGVTADLSGISGINNNPNFAIEIVNATEGTANLAAAGTALNNTSGNWSLDNIQITSVPEPTTLALAGLGLTGLIAFRQRNRKS